MARHDRITATELGRRLDYAEALLNDSGDFHLFHGIDDYRVDFRLTVGQLIDLGAPIADWRRDVRCMAVRVPDAMPVYYEGDTRRYGGTEAETLRGIRRDHEKALIDWLMADVPPVSLKSDEAKVCHWLIQHMPSVEDYVDGGVMA